MTDTRKAGKFGKLPAREDPRTLRLAAFLEPEREPPPDHFNLLPRCEKATGISDPRSLFPIDGNDRYGDCVAAACAHAITAWTAMVGKRRIIDSKRVVETYLKLSPSDAGLVEIDTLNLFRKTGLFGEKILAYVSVNWRKRELLKTAISNFGFVFIGFQVQENAVSDFMHHRQWTAGRLTNGGHAVLVTGYTADHVSCLTWGGVQRGDWSWVDQTWDECYAILPGEATLTGFAEGLDYAAIKQELDRVAA